MRVALTQFKKTLVIHLKTLASSCFIKMLLAALLLFNSCQSCLIKKPPNLEQNFYQVLTLAQSLPKSGMLIQQPDGYAYLKLDDRYIHELFPMLDAEPGFKKPPYFRRKNAPGAHISIIYEDEKVSLKEVGQTFTFELKDIRVVNTGKANFIVLEVFAPNLEQLRASYGLKPKLKGHEFHITIAKKAL